MVEINLKLYEFLKDKETHIYCDGNTGIKTWAVIYFYDLEEFTNIIRHHLYDGGIDVNLNDGYVAVELNQIIESEGNNISDYKNIFDESEYKKVYKFINR